MNNKPNAKILVFDRPLNPGENAIKDIFIVYGGDSENKDKYDLIVFPYKEGKERTEVVIFSQTLMHYGIMDLFEAKCEWPEGEPFGDFDLEGIDEQTFYDILDQRFIVTTDNLSDIEKH